MDEYNEGSQYHPLYPLVEWQWDLQQGDFSLDQTANQLLHEAGIVVDSIDDILSLMTREQRLEIKDAVKKVLRSGEAQYTGCCLMPTKGHLVYVEVYIEKADANTLQGYFRPLLNLPVQDDLSNLFHAIFENQHHGILVTDSQTRILACNRYFERQSGFLRSELIGLKSNIFNANKHSKEYYREMWQSIHTKGHWSGAILSQYANGEVIPQELTIQKMKLRGDRTYYVGLTVDLSEHLYRLEDKEDGGVELLTQLPTKSMFLTLLHELSLSESHKGLKVVIAFRPEFDEQQMYERKQVLSNALSRAQSLSFAGYLANGVFAVCIECKQNKNSDVRCLQQGIRQFFSELKQDAGAKVHIDVLNGRIGISVLGQDAENATKCVTHALQAMLENHSGQDSHISFYHSEIHHRIVRRKSLEEHVSHVIQGRALNVHYQPIIDTSSWRIAKLEALCRFPNIDGEPASTQELIEVAEDLELIAELDRAVAEIAMKDLPALQQVHGDNLSLTINRSLNTHMEPQRVLQDTVELIREHAADPTQITIEITESAYFDSESSQSNAWQALRELGATVAIDDFGTGYSSFTYLSDCHFDFLKIDREFVSNINAGETKYNIVKMITALSHQLNVKVVAEGVETMAELKILKSLGIDYMQGYLFSKPLALEDIAQAREYQQRLAEQLYQSSSQGKEESIVALIAENVSHLDPGDPISLVNEQMQNNPVGYLPVIIDKQCVGVVSQARLNLHLTPSMGTDLETLKEANIWHRPINTVMDTHFSQLNMDTPLNELSLLVDAHPFPWVVSNERDEFVGLIEQAEVIRYLMQLTTKNECDD